ncbi:Short chain dehydrogenase [Mycena venus]|uniref:Short chain dehydrogenase n=1 Tax=Mycena venus TaxID=2733690 RepID=A0A8H7D8U7_9AGAR|nr:Short chain dehydrogenase [Mycena venus]
MQFPLKLNFVALGAAIVALTASAAPAALEAQVDGHVFICTDANFSGDCTNYGFFDDQCSNFPDEFNDDISSFRPDAGWSCTMYTGINCTGDTFRGILEPAGPGFFNDAFSSVRCERI